MIYLFQLADDPDRHQIDAVAPTPTSAALSVLINPWANFGR